MRSRRWAALLTLALLLGAGGAAQAQAFSAGARLGLDRGSAEVTVEAAVYDAFGVRVAPVVTVSAAAEHWRDVSAAIVVGTAITYLPPESVWAVQLQVHYRVLWQLGEIHAGPEIYLGLVGSLW